MLTNVNSIEDAAKFLNHYIQQFNKPFSIAFDSIKSVFFHQADCEKANLILALIDSRKIDTGSALKYHNERYFPTDKNGTSILFRKDTSATVIKPFDERLFCCICEKVYTLEGIPLPIKNPKNLILVMKLLNLRKNISHGWIILGGTIPSKPLHYILIFDLCVVKFRTFSCILVKDQILEKSQKYITSTDPSVTQKSIREKIAVNIPCHNPLTGQIYTQEGVKKHQEQSQNDDKRYLQSKEIAKLGMTIKEGAKAVVNTYNKTSESGQRIEMLFNGKDIHGMPPPKTILDKVYIVSTKILGSEKSESKKGARENDGGGIER